MAIVQGNWSNLLSPGLSKAFNKAYKETSEEFKLGFTYKIQLLEDDLYGMLEKKTGVSEYALGRPEPQPRTLHVYDLGEGMLVPCDLVDDLFE